MDYFIALFVGANAIDFRYDDIISRTVDLEGDCGVAAEWHRAGEFYRSGIDAVDLAVGLQPEIPVENKHVRQPIEHDSCLGCIGRLQLYREIFAGSAHFPCGDCYTFGFYKMQRVFQTVDVIKCRIFGYDLF